MPLILILCNYSLPLNCIILSSNYSSVGTADVSKTTEEKDKEMRIELCLSEEERSLMMSDDIIQCLFSAVENWEAMKDKASPLNLPVSPHPIFRVHNNIYRYLKIRCKIVLIFCQKFTKIFNIKSDCTIHSCL